MRAIAKPHADGMNGFAGRDRSRITRSTEPTSVSREGGVWAADFKTPCLRRKLPGQRINQIAYSEIALTAVVSFTVRFPMNEA
jgi:hypothetical protein